MSLKIKKIVNTVLVGATILGGAIAFQSFGEKLEKKNQTTMHLVNKGTSYESRTNYSSSNCLNVSTETCAYKVLSPENIPNQSSYSPTEIQNFLDEGWIEALTSSGEYQN